ncbi:glutathione S-transferase U18-like [Phoenix dactylifera]|uniref:glutathione transferase n=1 Tax=Phoenix dactylifera TaxID=42345 RepID=A0A8B8J052_PHODC|nr:glutathione S-transferase U18-like [Phoenix dactylifera]
MAGGQELKLLGLWASPFVLRAGIALNLKGVGYEFLEEVPGTKSELLLRSNPVYKKMPVLIHNGKPICESMIIVQYIDEVWAAAGPSILPSDPYDRAIARFWAVYIDDKWFPALMKIIAAKADDEETAEAREQVIAGLQLLEEAFEKCSKGKDFFGGESVGYIDIAFGCYCGWLKAAEKMAGIKLLDKEKTPLLMGWAARFCSADAVKELMPEVDKLVEVGNMLRARQNAAATN